MASFRSILCVCGTTLIIGWFLLDFFKTYTRYEFVVKGDVCIALDRQENVLKVVGSTGCISIPMTQTVEDQMRNQIEQELTQKMQTTTPGVPQAGHPLMQ